MSNAVYYVSFKLKKSANVDDFLAASKVLNDEFISKQPGYISWEQVRDGDTWADFLRFETKSDLEKFKEISKEPSEIAKKFYSFMNPFTIKMHLFEVEKSHE